MKSISLSRSSLPLESGGKGIWYYPKYFLSLLLIMALAAASVFFALPLQNAEFNYIALFSLIVGIWVVYSLFFGFSFRAIMLWSALFFIKPFFMTFYALLGTLVFGIIATYYNSDKDSFYLPFPFMLTLLLGAAIQGFVRARDHTFAAPYFFATAIVPLLFLVYVSNAKTNKEDFKAWLKVIVVVAAVVGFIGVIMGVLNPNDRMGSLWITAMTINGFYTIAFFFAIALAMDTKDQLLKLLWFLASLMIFLGILYTYTRIALLAVVFGVAIIVWRIKRFRLLGMLLLMLIPLIIPASMLLRLQVGLNKDGSMFIRFLAWWFAIQQIIQRPFFGSGISVWKDWYWSAVPLKTLYAEHPHNIVLKIFTEIGLIGVIPYFYLIISIIRGYYLRCVKTSDSYFDFLILLAVLALLFSCITDVFIQQYSISIVFWSCLAFMYMRSKEVRYPAPNPSKMEK